MSSHGAGNAASALRRRMSQRPCAKRRPHRPMNGAYSHDRMPIGVNWRDGAPRRTGACRRERLTKPPSTTRCSAGMPTKPEATRALKPRPKMVSASPVADSINGVAAAITPIRKGTNISFMRRPSATRRGKATSPPLAMPPMIPATTMTG